MLDLTTSTTSIYEVHGKPYTKRCLFPVFSVKQKTKTTKQTQSQAAWMAGLWSSSPSCQRGVPGLKHCYRWVSTRWLSGISRNNKCQDMDVVIQTPRDFSGCSWIIVPLCALLRGDQMGATKLLFHFLSPGKLLHTHSGARSKRWESIRIKPRRISHLIPNIWTSSEKSQAPRSLAQI